MQEGLARAKAGAEEARRCDEDGAAQQEGGRLQPLTNLRRQQRPSLAEVCPDLTEDVLGCVGGVRPCVGGLSGEGEGVGEDGGGGRRVEQPEVVPVAARRRELLREGEGEGEG